MLQGLNLIHFMKTLRKLVLVLSIVGLIAFVVGMIIWTINLPDFHLRALTHMMIFYFKLILSWYWSMAVVFCGSLLLQLYSNDGVFQKNMIGKALLNNLYVVAVLFASFGFGMIHAPLNPLYLHVMQVWIFLELTFLAALVARRHLRGS